MDNRSVLHLAYQASKVQEQALILLHKASVKGIVIAKVASRWADRQGGLYKLAFKQQKFLSLMDKGKGRTLGILSAYGPYPKSVNQERHGKIMGDLQRMGYRPIPLKGEWNNVHEKSLLVPNIAPSDLFTLGREYKQDSVIYKSKDGVVGMYYPQGNYAEVAVNPELNPALDVAEGKDLYSKTRGWSFGFGFLWGQQVPWDGRHPIDQKVITHMISSGQLSFESDAA